MCRLSSETYVAFIMYAVWKVISEHLLYRHFRKIRSLCTVPLTCGRGGIVLPLVPLWFSFIQLKAEEDSLGDFQGAGQHQCHNRCALETERSPKES